ncbi:MAG: nucleoside-diphosphate kinase [Epsilonproteobacteria bacterium]|nr:nucleoside-diphosphate kinase [Campylobacterota bacterium]
MYLVELPQEKPVKNSTEQTLAIIKPDAVLSKATGKIIDRVEQEGFDIINLKKTTLSKEQAEKFYIEHKDKPFYKDLVSFMSSGPIIAMILSKTNSIEEWRQLMGATDPEEADERTMRKLFGTNKQNNAVHGSDSPEAAAREINFFFEKKDQQ